MKTYVITKNGKTTKIMADSVEEAVEIYNASFAEDALENYSSIVSKLKEIEHRYNVFREKQNEFYNKGGFPKSVLDAFKKDANDIKRLLNDAEARFTRYKSEMSKSLDDMYNALTKVDW